MRPVGPRSPQTYWFRRALALAVAVVVLIGAVWFVLGRNKGSGVSTAAQTSPVSSNQLTGVLASSADRPPSADLIPAASSAAGSATKPATVTSAKATAKPAPKTTAKATATPAAKTTAKSTAAPAPKTTAKPAPKTTATPAPKTAPKTTAPKTTAPKTTAPKTTAPKTTAPPPPSTDAQGRLLCPDSAIRLTATTGQPSYRVAQQPILGLTVLNAGTQSCVRDLSGVLQVFTVYTAAGKRIWSTADCFPGQGTDIRMLAPGESLPYNIKWSATTSSPGCAAQRVPVPAGGYTVVAALGALKSPPKAFTITS